jgi:hypothetical protein
LPKGARKVVGGSAGNLPVIQETWVQSLGQEDILKKGMATYSSILAWKFHGYSSQGLKELDMTE